MLSPSKLIPKAEAAKFARQLQRLDKERLDEWAGRKTRAAPRGKPKPRSLMGREVSQWRTCIERERRVAAGASSSVDVQRHVKRARWYVDQRDMAARVLQVRSRFPWLCDPSFNEEKRFGNVPIVTALPCLLLASFKCALVQSVHQGTPSVISIPAQFTIERSWSHAVIPDKTELVGQST